jgi:hypothetical protein
MQSGNTQSVMVSAVGVAAVDSVIADVACIYMGFSLREIAGSTAVVRIWDSKSSTVTEDVLLDTVSFAANESVREYYPEGLNASEGIWFDVVSGSVEGVVRCIKAQRRDLLDT